VQGGGDDPLAARLEHHQSLAAEQHDTRQADHLLGAHGVADDRERLLAHPIGGGEIVGRVEVGLVDLCARHEALNVDGVIALDLDGFQLLVLDQDVFALADLVALGLVLGLDRLAGLLVDELAADPVAGVAIESAEGDALGRGRGGVEGHRA
jgi:hypothetical protein